MTTRRTGLHHRDFAARPGPSLSDRLTRARVGRLRRLEQVQDVFRAGCRPQGQQLMIGVGERPSPADRDESGVAFFGQYHSLVLAAFGLVMLNQVEFISMQQFSI